MSTFMPLKDVTQHRLSTANKLSVKPSELTKVIASTTKHQQYEPRTQRYRHDPYNWNWRVSQQVHLPLVPQQQQQQALQPILPITMTVVVGPNEEPLMQQPFVVQQQQFVSAAVDAPQICRVLVQFKCHHNEFSSPIELKKGQYVVVQGDRGIDVGVVIRINTDEAQQYVERTGPTGSVVRHASQREVDYWASDLKQDETTALEYCRQRVVKHRLPMDVRHAEYQFDKKKLTFYYEAKARVDFVTLLKELFREFSCRIWMEKVRTHE